MHNKNSLNIWIFQTGEPLHIDGANYRPMRAMNLSNKLIDSGHKVVLWSSAYFHQEKNHRADDYKIIDVSDNLQIRLVPSRGYKHNIGLGRLLDHAQLALNLRKYLKSINELPDVAFVGYPPIELAYVAVRWLRNNNIPTLLDVKDQWPSLFIDAFPASLKLLARILFSPYSYLAKITMRNATGVASMAPSFLEWIRNYSGREPSRFDGVYPLTSPGGEVSDKELEEARLWWENKNIRSEDGLMRIIFVGSFMSVFDFEPIMQAANKFKHAGINVQFVLCGSGGSFEKIKSTMSGLSNITFPGWIDRPKIEALSKLSNAAIAPYLNIDNFTVNIPNKIVDSISLGLPILSPLTGEVGKIIKDYHVGMQYGDYSSKTLFDCVMSMIEDPDDCCVMSKNAKGLYRKRFSFDKVYTSLVDRLENLAQLN